jgi:two-component system phosphate regulon response regulator OmpR
MHAAAIRHHVLVLDLPSPRRSWLVDALGQRGFAASACDTLDEALLRIEGSATAPRADLILLRPQGSPDDGLRMLRRIRAVSVVPLVLMGGPAASFGDRVAALELGADDYVGAAMPLQEVLARLRAVLRRAALASRRPPRAPDEAPDARLIEGGWRLALNRRALVGPDGEAALPLTGAEFELLRLLAAADGEPVDRETISRSVFRRPWQIEDRAVDGLVKRLRRKLQADAIASVRGVGYAIRFAEAGTAAETPLFVPETTTMACSTHPQVEICVTNSTLTNPGVQSAVVD